MRVDGSGGDRGPEIGGSSQIKGAIERCLDHGQEAEQIMLSLQSLGNHKRSPGGGSARSLQD